MNVAELETRSREDLLEIAKELGISGYSTLKKQELVTRLLQAQSEQDGAGRANGDLFSGGILETVDDGYGFLRGDTLLPGLNDIYVSQSQVRRFGLRTGDLVTGLIRPPRRGRSTTDSLRVETVNSLDPEVARRRPYFEALTPIFPEVLINLEPLLRISPPA